VSGLFFAQAPSGESQWIWQNQQTFLLPEFKSANDLPILAATLLGQETQAWENPEHAVNDFEKWKILKPGNPGKVLALGKNFAAHAREFGAEPPKEPLWFNKFPDILIGPDEAVVIPSHLQTRVDHEAEVVLLLGAPLHHATAAEATAAVAAFTLGNDVTARKVQSDDRKHGHPWLRSKNLSTFGPLGPAWIPADQVDLGQVTLECSVNDELRQKATLADLIFSPGIALAEISRWVALFPGDILFLGTPEGVGPVKPGQRMEVRANGLGVLRNPVVAG